MADDDQGRALGLPARSAVFVIAFAIRHWLVSIGIGTAAIIAAGLVVWATAPPSDPASDARLAQYEAAGTAAAKIADPVRRCERFATAYAVLTPVDKSRIANPRMASDARRAAVAEGRRCADLVGISDAHFQRLSVDVMAARDRPAASVLRAVSAALTALDDFDRARERAANDPDLFKEARADIAALEASTARVARLNADAAALRQNRTQAATIQLARDFGDLTDLDRTNIATDQAAALEDASTAAQAVQKSRDRLAQLPGIVQQAQQSPDQPNQERLRQAVSLLTDLDDSVATPAQQRTIAQARELVVSLPWTLLGQRLGAMAQDASPDHVAAVASLLPSLGAQAAASLTEDQRQMLAKAHEAADTMSASDRRIQELLDDAKAWRQHGPAAGEAILAPLATLTPFDRARFDPDQSQALEALRRAEAIIRAPKLGLTAATKTRLEIFVVPADASARAAQVASSLRDGLRSKGFALAHSRDDAALIATVGIQSAAAPTVDMSGAFIKYRAAATLAIAVTWAAGGAVFLSDQMEGSAVASDRATASAQALLAADNAIVARLSAMAAQ